MKTLKVQITGIRPLLMSNPQTVDVTNPYGTNSRRINNLLKKARKKEDESMMAQLSQEQKENDFTASAYFDASESKFFIPDTVILACIKESAKAMKKGKDIDRAVQLSESEAYISGVPTVKSLSEAYKHGAFTFGSPCKIPPRTGALMWKIRCMMPTGWKASFELMFDEEIITGESLRAIVDNAGILVGVGGWRPKFGRFTAEFPA